MAAKNGIRVALIEKEETIAESVRTSGVTWIQNIKEFGIPDDCFNAIKNFSFCSPNNTVTISDTVARAAVLDVRKTYRWLADEAKKAGVKHIIYTSAIHQEEEYPFDIIADHQQKEAYLLSSGISYTAARNGLCLDIIPSLIGDVLGAKKIYYPGGKRKTVLH